MAKNRTAKLTEESSNGRDGLRLRFYDSRDKRRAIWLGKIQVDEAQIWLKHVEHLANCCRLNDPPSPMTTRWVASLTVRNRAKLERVGLVDPNEASIAAKHRKRNVVPNQLGAFLDWYIDNHAAKPRTVKKWHQCKECLLRYFKAGRKLSTITAEEAESWRLWLCKYGNIREGKERKGKNGQLVHGRTALAEATVRRRTGQVKQFFTKAKKCNLINANPFESLASTVHGNRDRSFFVTREMISSMIEHAPTKEWQCILALARYGGLRAPSDMMRLKWEDLDFVARRMCIRSPKTEHHKNRGIRYCPIFPELLPFLEDLAELAKHRGAKPTDYVITKPRGSESVLRSGMESILKRSGIPLYPKLFNNLRASRETELLDEFPIMDVCAWIGNSPKVAMEHYAMVRQESFDRAAGLAPNTRGPNGGPKNGDSRHLEATEADFIEPNNKATFPSNSRENATLVAVGNSLEGKRNRPGRT